jgi:hypothetical protein
MYRRIGPALMLATLISGCGGDEAMSESTVVATIGEAQLTAGELEALLIQAPEAPTIVQGQAVLSTWLDHAGYLVAQSRGDDLRAAGARDEVTAPEVARASILALAAATRQSRPIPTDAQVDSLAALGTVRAFERFSVPLPDPTDSVAVDAGLRRLAELRRAVGALPQEQFSIAALPAEVLQGLERSTTPGLTRAELPPAISGGLWRLEPGMISDFISGAGGAQVFIRLPADQIREQLRVWLADRLNLAADQRFVDSLAATAKLTFADDAVTRMRALGREPIRSADTAPLGTFEGGQVTVADARTWIGYMPPATRAGILIGSDSAMSTLLTEAGKRAIMQRIAPAPSPEAVAAIEANYATRLDSLDATTSSLDASASPTDKAKQWITQIFAGQRPLIPLPGAMGLFLRDRYEATVNFEALEWVVERAASAWAVKSGTET